MSASYPMTFDDDPSEPIFVFGAGDLLGTYLDQGDPGWDGLAERTEIDERRGPVICQVVALEDLVDELLTYLEDPDNPSAFRSNVLAKKTIGPRLNMLEEQLCKSDLLNDDAQTILGAMREIVDRRNALAHGSIECPPRPFHLALDSTGERVGGSWVLVDRRSGLSEHVSMAGLREDVRNAAGMFFELLRFAESIVARVPRPRTAVPSHFLVAPSTE